LLKQIRSVKYFQVTLLFIVMLSSLMTGGVSIALAQAGAPELFSEAVSNAPGTSVPDPAFVVRSRSVNINMAALFGPGGNSLDASANPEIIFNLFPNTRFTGLVSQVQQNSIQTIWIGTLREVPEGYFYLLVSEGIFIAHIASPQGIYEVSLEAGGVYKLIQIDQSVLGEDAPGKPFEGSAVLSKKELAANADSGSVIDILVVYTPAARAAEGSTAAMKARIALAIAESNQAYSNAGVATRLRLVHTEELAYTEIGNLQTEVNRLTGTGDGFMDGVHTLRNAYGADMVALIVENGGPDCGMPRAILASAATAFQVTRRPGCMTGAYTFTHEFAHLQGARHDTFVDPAKTPFAYGHGYVHPGATTSTRWRTVMAYNSRCVALGYNCTRLQYFSNPINLYNSVPMGVEGENEVYKVLDATRYTVANFRKTVIGANFFSNFSSNATGWMPVYGGWDLTNSNYYTTTGVAGSLGSSKHAGTYGDLTFTVRLKRTGSDVTDPTFLIIRGNPASLNIDKDWNSSYQFGYTNGGTFSVWKVNASGINTALKPWTSSTAIIQNNWNTLKVVAVGPQLKFYINGVLVYAGADSGIRTGQVGISMYRNATATDNMLYIDSASLSNTPTADITTSEALTEGVETPGNTKQGPQP
jgi:hypothetical protein